MAKSVAPHQVHMDMMNAFDGADRGTPKTGHGGQSYGMASTGLPRSAGQMASVKKAAQKSAMARGERAGTRSPMAPVTAGPAAVAAGPLKPPPGISTGGLGIANKPKKGLLA